MPVPFASDTPYLNPIELRIYSLSTQPSSIRALIPVGIMIFSPKGSVKEIGV